VSKRSTLAPHIRRERFVFEYRIMPAVCYLAVVALTCVSCRVDVPLPMTNDLVMSNPMAERQLIAGLWKIENGQWCWAKKRFAVVLRSPDGVERYGGELRLQLFIPDGQIQKLGPMTLTAEIGDRSLGSQTFTSGGSFSYTQTFPPMSFKDQLVPVVFAFDKVLAPWQTDGRELSAVISEVSLDRR